MSFLYSDHHADKLFKISDGTARIHSFSTTANSVQHNPSVQTLNKSVLNHLFLPCYLPNSSEDDYLIGDDHQNEYELLELMKEFLKSLTGNKFSLEFFRNLIICIERWINVQDRKKLSADNFQKTIDQLVPGDFLPIYFHCQNAAILIEIERRQCSQTLPL